MAAAFQGLRLAALGALIPGVWAGPPDSLIILAKQRMAANSASLPNYTCLETIERSVRRREKSKPSFHDRIRVEVAYINGREMFSWPGAHAFEPDLLRQIPQVGISGTGAFGGWTRSLFGANGPAFAEGDRCSVSGRNGRQYTFRVPVERSNYTFRFAGRETIMPYSGSICVDPETSDVMEMDIDVGQLPAPIAANTESLHYRRTRVGSADFLLPRDDEVTIRDENGTDNRNRAEFSACREYGSESSISFDAQPEAAPEAPQGPAEIQLPAGLQLDLALSSPITSQDSAVGDAITARLNRAVTSAAGNIPKGALVSGRVRGLEQYLEPYKYFLVTLEFSSVAVEAKRAIFQARLVGPQLQVERRVERGSDDGAGALPVRASRSERRGLEIEGKLTSFGTFRVRGGNLRLRPGLHMIYETEGEGR